MVGEGLAAWEDLFDVVLTQEGDVFDEHSILKRFTFSVAGNPAIEEEYLKITRPFNYIYSEKLHNLKYFH